MKQKYFQKKGKFQRVFNGLKIGRIASFKIEPFLKSVKILITTFANDPRDSDPNEKFPTLIVP